MTPSRSDRPYGSFPGGRPEARPEPEALRPQPTLRQRVWRRLSTPLAIAALAFVSAVDSGARHALRVELEQPTASPTPPLATLVYQHVAPSVVQVNARGRGDRK